MSRSRKVNETDLSDTHKTGFGRFFLSIQSVAWAGLARLLPECTKEVQVLWVRPLWMPLDRPFQ